MERHYGRQSYHPKGLSLLFWGNGENRYYHLCDNKISQNILFACYNDKLTAEQISLEIGVALPYMEDNLKELCDYDLLKKDGKRYYTNIVIFTEDFVNEVTAKTTNLRKRVADTAMQAVTNREDEVRRLGFAGADMSGNSFVWQMVCFVLYYAVVENLQSKLEDGMHNTWKSQFGFGISSTSNDSGYVQFMDFPINGEMVHPYFYNRQSITIVILDIARGKTGHLSETDKAAAAELVLKGYVI